MAESEKDLQLSHGDSHVHPTDVPSEPPPGPTLSPTTEEPVSETKKKIDVLLKAVGDTPIMKTKKWTMERSRTIQSLMDFIKKFLKFEAAEQLCFGSDGKLVLHYCKSQAWG
ncbi:ubiquitin-like protein ATG12 isoform X2 [Ambystoma mexicanum]|uniref:ubiquitin-like protein ATG12 isoform X2 n=1 Tax=Ambystoma mexicanum TaxID=8296 RepID=UPI0037E7F208